MATITVDVEVDLDEFEDNELIDELRHRCYHVSDDPIDTPDVEAIVHELYVARCLADSDLDTHLNRLFEAVLNKRI